MNNKLTVIEDIVSSGEGINYHIFRANRNCRKRNYVEVRQIVMCIASELTKITYEDIAALYDKDHSNVNHSKKVIGGYCDTNKLFLAKYNDYKDKCEIALKEIELMENVVSKQIYDSLPKSVNVKISDSLVLEYKLVNVANPTDN